MSKTHTAQDVYVNDRLAFTDALVLDIAERQTVRVKARIQGKAAVWTLVLEVTEANGPTITKGDSGSIRSWTALDPDGEPIRLAAIGRKKDCGCR